MSQDVTTRSDFREPDGVVVTSLANLLRHTASAD
jgi:hypothetical protein